MENLCYLYDLLNKFNHWYFLRETVCKNNFRKAMFLISWIFIILFELCYLAFTVHEAIFLLLILSMFFQFYTVFHTMDKDYASFIPPKTHKLLNHRYRSLKLYSIKKNLQQDRVYEKNFLNKSLAECEAFLLLESNSNASLYKHPIAGAFIAIATLILGNTIWESINKMHILFIYFLISMHLFIWVLPMFESRFQKIRTIKFFYVHSRVN
ncbi:hypothetical protein Lery_2857 [Legionella erythra]|uniref:Uncharacterized protein n=2 Tax=Legionella erythra TaxID=448 RepID=A0A0W0TGH7_LEGER|nr:hypothetical protein Lery_2857 [Legionella erythra]